MGFNSGFKGLNMGSVLVVSLKFPIVLVSENQTYVVMQTR